MPSQITTSGPAARVVVFAPGSAQSFEGVVAHVDAQHGMVHVLSADGGTHYLSVPVSAALIEWRDAAALQPRPYVPAYGSGAFDAVGTQMEEMMAGLQRGLGRE